MSTFRSSKTGLLCREALFQCAGMVIVTVVAFVVLKLVLSDLEPYSSTRDLLSGNADNISGEALNFTTLPLGCVASCMPQGAANNLSLPGMPDALPPGCSAIRVENCTKSNACAKLAEDVVMDQTIFGMIIYWLVMMSPLFAIKPEKQKLMVLVKALIIGGGAINAVVQSWRLIADLFSALGEEDTACLWPHSYYDGASFLLDASGKRFSILTFVLVALCPTNMFACSRACFCRFPGTGQTSLASWTSRPSSNWPANASRAA